MTLSEALRGVKRVAFDSSAIIDFGEERERSLRLVTAFFRRMDLQQIEAIGTMLLLPEVMTYARLNADNPRIYEGFLAKMRLIPVTEEVAERATDYRVMYNLRTTDTLVTSDADFLRAQGVPVGNPGAGRSLRIVYTEKGSEQKGREELISSCPLFASHSD